MNTLVGKMAATLCAVALVAPALAQGTWPDKPIRIIVPFSAGTGLDVMARGYAEVLSEQMKTSVVVENKDGAGGTIGAIATARAPADGYTIMFTAHAPFAVAPFIQSGATYDPRTDFSPIAKVALTPMVLLAGTRSPFQTFGDMVSYAKTHPGKLFFATSGVGAPSQLHMEVIKKKLGLQMDAVPYKSAGQAMTDLIGGQLPLYMPSYPAALSHIKSGQVRPLAIGSTKRLSDIPDVPTVAEVLNQPGLTASVWYGFLAPKGVPEPVITRLYAEIEKAATSAKVDAIVKQISAEAVMVGPREFGKDIAEDTENSRRLVKSLGAGISK